MKIQDNLSITGEVKWIKQKNGIVLDESGWMKNQVLTGSDLGVSIVLDRMVGINTYTLNICYADIGIDNTPATSADTSLGNGVARSSVGTTSRSGVQAEFKFFYPDATTPDNTYTEFGMFVDGTTTVGTGQIFNRLIFATDLVKATGEDYTIVCRITVSV